MAIKKFKVMASNAKKKAKSDGSCIPKSMRKDVKSGCTKKSVKASDTAKKFRVDIYKKDNPDALVKREVKTFNSEDEAKKYGESIANGDIVNVIEVKAGCTKKSVKASYDDADVTVTSFKTEFGGTDTSADYTNWVDVLDDVDRFLADGAYVRVRNNRSNKEFNISPEEYRTMVYVDAFSGDEHKEDFDSWFINKKAWTELGLNLYTKKNQKSVKSSKSLTVPKSKRKSVKASSDGWKETDYSVFMDGGRQLMSKYTKEFDNYRVMILPEYNAKTDILSWVVFLFDVDEEPRRLESFETAYDAKDFADYEVYEGYVKPVNSSKSVKKFGVKASATAKRIAKSRITAAESDGLKRAKQYIVDGYNAENSDSADMTVDEYFKNEDLHKVGLVYTTLGDNDEYDYQISVDLIDPKVIVEIDGDVVYADKYSNIDALADDLADFDWDNWYSYYIHKLPAGYDDIFSSCSSAKSIKCSYKYSDFDKVGFEFDYNGKHYTTTDFPTNNGKFHAVADNGVEYIMYISDIIKSPISNPPRYKAKSELYIPLGDFEDYDPNRYDIDESKDIKCNDGIAPDDYDSVEDLVPEAYALSGGEDDDMLEYVDDYIATEGCPATVNFVTYNTPNDWSVDVSKYGEAVVSDFIWYLEEVASELSDKFYDYPSYEDDTTRNAFKGTKYEEGGKYATFYGDNALVANDYEFQFYPAQNQWSAPQIEFDTDELKLIGFTDDEIDELMRIYEDYKAAWIENCKYINAHISEFLANLESNVNASTNIKAGITVGQDDRYDFSNPIYELDDYVKALADGTVNQVQGITYDISKETVAFFDADNNVVFVQPIGGIIPEPDDLETDIDELSAAIKSEMDNAYARDNWEQDNDDSDYASRAVELSEDIGEVDIDDLEPITGDGDDENIDYGFGFDSNGEALDESTVEELYRIAEYEILPKSELAKIDEYVSIDEDSWDFYMSSPHVTEKFYIHFKLTEKDIDFNKYALPEATAFPDFNYYTAVLDFDIYTENGEVTSVVLEDTEIYKPDGAFDDYDVKRFDKLYNVDAIINYVEALAADTVMDIYNGTTNL